MSSVFKGGLKRLILLFAMQKHRSKINLQSRGNGVTVMIVCSDFVFTGVELETAIGRPLDVEINKIALINIVSE